MKPNKKPTVHYRWSFCFHEYVRIYLGLSDANFDLVQGYVQIFFIDIQCDCLDLTVVQVLSASDHDPGDDQFFKFRM